VETAGATDDPRTQSAMARWAENMALALSNAERLMPEPALIAP